MRIAYVVGSFPFVSETFIANEIVSVAARGHLVDIFTTCEGEITDIPRGVIQYGLMQRTYPLFGSSNLAIRFAQLMGLLVTYGWRSPKILLRALSRVRRNGFGAGIWLIFATLRIMGSGNRSYDVVHAQFGPYGLLATELKEIGAISGAVVTSFRGFDATKELRSSTSRYRHLFAEGSLFLPVSTNLAERLIDAGCEASKVRVHRSGIDCGRLFFATRQSPNAETTQVITVGRLVEKKGIRYGLEAVAVLVAAGRSIHYTIVGDGPLRRDLENLVAKLGISSAVSFMGWKSHEETLEAVKSGHILLAPSVTAADGDEEGIPNSLKEAMALGIPVVASRHAGIPELVEDGVSGLLTPERDARALADHVARLIDHPEIRTEVASAARRRIEADFDSDLLGDRLIELYAEAMQSPPHGCASESHPACTATSAR